jgi:hypothetical protein
MFLFLALALTLADDICNCVGCSRTTLIPFSNDWIRCCNQTMLVECNSSSSTDAECRQSVFSFSGCVQSGFGEVQQNISFLAGPVVTFTESTATFTLPSATLPRTLENLTTYCNCVGCSRTTLIQFGNDWNRCCAQTALAHCNSSSSDDVECRQSVFSRTGCLQAGFRDRIEGADMMTPGTFSDTASTSSPSVLLYVGIAVVALMVTMFVAIVAAIVYMKRTKATHHICHKCQNRGHAHNMNSRQTYGRGSPTDSPTNSRRG